MAESRFPMPAASGGQASLLGHAPPTGWGRSTKGHALERV